MRAFRIVLISNVALLAGCPGGATVKPPDLGGDDTLVGDDTDDGSPSGVALAAGDLVITEVMVASLECPGVAGQYVELFNTSAVTVDLAGLEIGDGEASGVITRGTILPGAYAFGVPASAADCHGVGSDFIYEDVEFVSAPGGGVRVWSGASLIDEVDIASWLHEPGVAWQLDLDPPNDLGNDLASAWCGASGTIGRTLDFGSPREPTRGCNGVTPETVNRVVSLAEMDPGRLVITEVMIDPSACGKDVGQFIEVRNTGTFGVDLTGLRISNGEVIRDIDTTIVLERGGYAWFSAGTTDTYCLRNTTIADGTWGDGLEIQVGDTLSVGVGEPYQPLDAVPLTGFVRERGASFELSQPLSTTNLNDQLDSWCYAESQIPGEVDFGSPGESNDECLDFAAGRVPEADELVVGDIVITEMMVDPVGCPDYDAEYFEIYNGRVSPVNLRGLRITVNGLTVQLSNDYIIQPESYALAEFFSGATPAACYPGLIGEFLWNTGQMPNTGTSIRLSNDFFELDVVDLTRKATVPGASLQLDSRFRTVDANDSQDVWCHATRTFPGSLGDLGSPQAANDPCPAVDAGDTGDTDPPDVPEPPRDLGLAELVAGDLIITEIMANPEDCADFAAEYIEVYNRRELPVNITGLRVLVGGTSVDVSSVGDPIPAGGYGLLRYTTGAPPACYGLVANALYVMAARMPDNGAVIRLSHGGTVFDEVNATNWAQFAPGAAIELDNGRLDASLNNDAAMWCRAAQVFPSAAIDLGSPGEPNPGCGLPPLPAPVDTDAADTDAADTDAADTDAGLDTDAARVAVAPAAPAPVLVAAPGPWDPSAPGLPIVGGVTGPFLVP
jgi:hypothetical protein